MRVGLETRIQRSGRHRPFSFHLITRFLVIRIRPVRPRAPVNRSSSFHPRGVLGAAEIVGRKYLDPKVYRAIRSPRYRSILEKLADEPLTRNFKKKDLERRLNDNERKVLHNFLRRLRQLGVIEADTEQERGTYRFVNDLYRVYIHLVSQRTKKT